MLETLDRTPQYQTILDESFRRFFPEWDSMSEWDPIKLFAESLSGSLAAIEKRQNRLTHTLIDSIPSLLAFDIQPARLPGALLELVPAPRLKSAALLEKGTALRFNRDAAPLFAGLESDFHLEPIHQLNVTVSGKKVTLAFQYSGASQSLRFHFLPAAGAKAVVLLASSVRLLENHTQGFSRVGSFVADFGAVPVGRVEFVLEFDEAPQGSFHTNVAAVELFTRVPEITLGSLKGEPWEVIALPPELSEAPRKILLRFPDEQTLELGLEREELLRLRHTDPARFSRCFFYNGTRHEIVIPSAASCMRGYLGGVLVQLHNAAALPDVAQIPANAPFSNEQPKLLQNALPLLTTRKASARETPQAYLTRFYSLVREIPLRPRTAFFPQEICLEIPRFEPRVRRAEFSVDPGGEVVFRLLLGDGVHAVSGDEEAEILAHVESTLRRQHSLNAIFRVAPFISTTLVCQVEGAGSTLVAAQLEHLIQPPPLGGLELGVQTTAREIEQRLRQNLGAPLTLRFSRGAQRILVETIARAPGESFLLQVENETAVLHA